MPYYARKHQLEAEIAYHVLNRANRRLKIFHDEEDYEAFKGLLKRYSHNTGMLIYHYCIMPNHYHFSAELAKPERFSGLLAGVNRLYTVYYHKKYKTAGYLWQGRFKSKPVQKDEYLIGLGRYIERNPVEGKVVATAAEYKYSSARHYVLGEKDEIVTENPSYKDFGATEEDRRNNYARFLLDFDPQEALMYADNSVPVGDKGFKSKLLRSNGRLVPRRKGKPRNPDLYGNLL